MQKSIFKVVFLAVLVFMSSLAVIVNVKGPSNVDTSVSRSLNDATNVSGSNLDETIAPLVIAREHISSNSSPPILTSDGGGLNSSVHEGPAPGRHSQPLLTPLIGPTEISPSHTFDHWWVLDYWDTSSGGNLPSFMSGEFIAVDNTIEGLQAGWEGITPWYDAVLYLPLNVAYGTSWTNCVWFQFDIQFIQPGLGWPFPGDVWWGIWDIRGPGTQDADYHATPIGIDYEPGHEYWFSLMTSGTNTVTFYIIDETSGASWSKSDWKWSVPSTNMLADESMFSPASAIEGYTTGASLSNVPFFQTRVGEGVTVNRHYSLGPVPSGITTDRIAIGTYNLWYWMMLTPSSLPIPSISSVDYPSGIGVGQSATIDATVINNGGTAAWYQTIAISFPSGESIFDVSIIQTDLSSSAIHGAGETVGAAYSTTTITLQNYLVEGASSWPSGVSHHLKISVTPDGTGSFKFYVKSVAAVSNWACNWDPKTGDKDRQLEFVKTYTIAVGVNPSSISVNVNPDSIFLGGGTTISGSITSSTPGDKTGTVYLQYSTNNVNWNDIGSTTSSSSGAYSHWWEPSTTGTFYVRSYWNGNSEYGDAISSSFYPFKVKTPGGNLDDHCMCKGVQSEYPWDPIERTNVFYTDDPKAHSWLKFVDIYDGPHYVHWDWYDPDGVHWTWDETIPAPSPGEYWVWYKKSSNLGPLHFADSKLGRAFTTKVYYDGNLVVTETWTVIKHQSSITVSLSSNSITYGQSVTIDSQLSPSFSDGTTTLQYSTDGVNWNNIAAGTPSNGHYSRSWKPPAVGTYYVRAKWSGNLNYYGSTSSTKTLTVDKAATTLTTTLSSTPITYGASVTITASMSPQLQGKTVTIQYSLDNSNWYDLSSGTTNAAGEYAFSWTPAVGSYYIRSTWGGDTNYHSATSPSQHLVVNQASTSTSCTLSSDTINYGESVTVTGTVNVPVNDGIITLEYSTDGVDWNLISSGTPLGGSYSYTWTPPSGGTFYIRAVWSGNHNYLGSTSSSQTLTVRPAEEWVPYVPTAEQTEIEITTEAGVTCAKVTIAFPNTGYRVQDWGTVSKTDDEFSVDAKVERWTGTSLWVITELSHTYQLGLLEAGTYVFTFKAWGMTVEDTWFTIDTTPPVVQITNPTTSSPIYTQSGTTLTVDYTYTELNPKNATIKIRNATHIIGETIVTDLVPGVDVMRSDSVNIAAWATDGPYNITVTIYDLADQTGTDTQTNAVIIDNIPPIKTIVSPSPRSYLDFPTVWINETLSDATSGIDPTTITMTLDETPVTPDYNPTTGLLSYHTIGLAEGNHTVVVSVRDLAGNLAINSWWFFVDTTSPTITIQHTPGSSFVYLTAEDIPPTSGVFAIYAKIDDGSWEEHLGSGPIEFVLTATGSHLIEAYSKDNAGNESPLASLAVHFLTVNTDPSSLDAPTGEGWYDDASEAPISVSPVPNYNFEYWYLDGQSEIPYSTSMSTTVTMNTPHTATAKFQYAAAPFAHIYIEHTYRGDIIVTIGVSDPANPLWSYEAWSGQGGGEDNLDLTIDLSEAVSYLPPSESSIWFLKVYDRYGGDQGSIIEFTITYEAQTYASTDVPVPIYDRQTSYAYIPSLPATIQGYVTDALTSDPISGSRVTCNGYENHTEADGFYQFLEIPSRTYTVTAEATGYQTETFALDASAGGTFEVNFSLAPSGLASAHIFVEHTYRGDLIIDLGVGAPGNPDWSTRIWNGEGGSADNLDLTVDISEATQYLPPSESFIWFLKVYDRYGGDQGQIVEFTITYQDQTYISTDVPVPIYDRQTSYAYIPSGPPPPPPATIQGYVTDASTGDPISGATVTCNSYVDYTELDGFYQFLDIPAQAYTITAEATGYEPRSVTVDASPGGTFEVSIALTPSPPPPEASAHVFVEHTYRGDLIVDLGVGDLANPDWSTRIWNGEGGSADNLDLTVDISQATQYLPPSETNRWFLKVYDRYGGDQGSIIEFTITYEGLTNASRDVPVPIYDRQTSYAYIPSATPPPPPPPATIQGYVTDALTGDPITGATVTCNSYVDYTEADGLYQFLEIPSRTYTVVAEATGYQTETFALDASAGGIFEVNFSLAPSGLASAHIYIEHTYRGDLIVDLGVGDPANPEWSTRIWNGEGGGADNLDLTFDLSEAIQYLPPSESNRWFLKVSDRYGGDQGQIVEFTITHQDQTYSSPDVPVPIYDRQTSYAYIPSAPPPPPPPAASAHIYIEHTYIGDLVVTIGVGDPNDPLWSSVLWSRQGGGTDNLDLTVDLSDAIDYLPPSETHTWFLMVYDAASWDQGQIIEFTITYEGYTYSSTDVPVPIYDLQTSYAYISE